MDGDDENYYVNSFHVPMNSHTLYQQNDLNPLINSKNRDDIEINSDLNNGYVICGICLINHHTLCQLNE